MGSFLFLISSHQNFDAKPKIILDKTLKIPYNIHIKIKIGQNFNMANEQSLLKRITDWRLTSFAMLGTASHNLWLVRQSRKAMEFLMEKKRNEILMTGGSVEQVVDKLLLLGNKEDAFADLASELVEINMHTADKLHFHLAVAIQEKLGGAEDAE